MVKNTSSVVCIDNTDVVILYCAHACILIKSLLCVPSSCSVNPRQFLHC